MKKNIYALFGIAGPLIAYVLIGVSISLSPWFSWERNALSDLGHSVRSGVATIFNIGLLLAGFLITIYAVTAFRKHAKYTAVCLLASAFLLQLIATFDELYGFLHLVVSVLFFVSIGITSVVYAVERKSFLGLAPFMIALASWILYWMKMYSAGIAVPETISSVAVALLLISSALKTYSKK